MVAKQARVQREGRHDPEAENQETNLCLWLVQLVRIQVQQEPKSMCEYGFSGVETLNKPEPHSGDDKTVRR